MKGKTGAKRGLALALAGTMLASTFGGAGAFFARAAESDYIGDAALTDTNTQAPTPDEVVPNANQYWYQKAELSAFCHFGPNTFNEIEWGENYGNKTPDEIFKLEQDFDADTMVKTLKDAGFKMLIVTAKHHDGFCIWASDYTTYDVANTSYKNGQGDILAELSTACTKYDMDMGLYLSPWDIHDPSYGYYKDDNKQQPTTNKEEDLLDYNEYYNNQLQEILGNDKYGNNGHFREVWMDGAKGSGANAQEYDFQLWFDTIQKNEGKVAGYDADCMLFGAQAYTTVRWIGNENGYAADNTWSKSTVNYDNNTINSGSSGGFTVGVENGNQWTVPEADARITSGWFWGTTKNTPKTIAALGEMYFRSVGHNATLLLNVPPNNQGTVDQAILDRVTEFGQNVRDTFDQNLAVSAQATNVRGKDVTFKPGNTLDGNDSTYWTTDDGTNSGTLLIDLGGTKSFDVVSIEEAIQNGQRINQYKVEYRDASGQWHEMQSGKTIGAKRLVRTSAVRGDQVRITVTTPEGKVPMLSEVGVYKASEGFELSGAAPDGMDVIDVTNNAFTFGKGWTGENGAQFIGGTNKWANSGATFTVNFTGSKIYLLGTKDPNHGKADIYIDGEKVSTIDTNASARALGQYIYESPDLKDGQHTLELRVTSKAIGIEAAYTINNGGKGMVGLEMDQYTMNEEQRMEVKLVRVGGTSDQPVTVRLSPNPGSAIQDDFNTELITEVTFQPGETEKTAPVETKRNTNVTGDREFTIELSSNDKDLILGFNPVATVTIKDKDSEATTQLQALVDEAADKHGEWYSAGWDAYAQAVAAGKALLDEGSTDQEAMAAAATAITQAKEGLVEREQYSADDPVPFPWQPGSSYTLEAEFAILNNTGTNEKWPLQVSKQSWASHGEFINSLNNGDSISFPYVADRAGTYTVTATYRSGSTSNKLKWSEPDGKITAGEKSAGNGNAGVTKTVSFDLVVTKAGAGTLVFTAPQSNSPQLDKLVITPKTIDYQERTVTVNAGEGGTVTTNATEGKITEGQNLVITVAPNANYHLVSLMVNGQDVTADVADNTYTVENVVEDITIDATFAPDMTKADLQALVDEANGKLGEWYSQGWAAYAQAIAQAKTLLEQENPSIADMAAAKTAIETAKAALVEREQYSTDDPYVFPNVVDGSSTLEAEFAILKNTGENESWPLQVSKGDWASHGEFINSLNQNDTISFPYVAEKAGTYSVTATYRSGSSTNKLVWSEPDNKITAGEKSAGNGNASVTKTVTFDLVVTEAGAGTLVFTGPNGKSPQLDKLVITLKEVTDAPSSYTVTFNTNGGTEIAPVTVTENDKVAKPADPTKEGFTFAGWFTDEACQNAYNFDTAVTSSFTLYAKWTAVDPQPSEPVVTDKPQPSEPVVTDKPEPSAPVVTDKPEPTAPVEPSAPVTGGNVTVDNKTNSQITVGNADQVFGKGTVITVENVENGTIYNTVKEALKNVVADMKDTSVLEITASLDGKAVQPTGAVQMTFQIPQHLSADNLKLFYVATDGTKEEIPITVDKNARTVTANLEHFSTYVLANVAVNGAGNGVPATGDANQLMLTMGVLMASAVALGGVAVVSRKRRG